MSCSCKHNKEAIDNGLADFGECEEMSDELKNIIKRGVALYQADILRRAELSEKVRG